MRGDLDLPQETLGSEQRGALGLHHLDGNWAAVLEIGGAVDHGHPTVAQLALDDIPLHLR